MTKHILTKEQRLKGLDTHEDDHNIYITDTTKFEAINDKCGNKTVAVFSSSGATIQGIQKAANDYLISRGK